jgi:hypothetical protein
VGHPPEKPPVWRTKSDREWRIGRGAEVAWIEEHTTGGRGITGAVPPMFEAYATVQLPVTPNGSGGWSWAEGPDRHDASVLGVLTEHTVPQAWWLGYLVTGIGAETIFYDVPKAKLCGCEYVLVEAGPEQAGGWRAEWGRWKGVLPDLMYPADRSWLASTLWDDYWMSIGGSRDLVDALLADPELRARVHEVDPWAADMTPPQAAST